MWYPRREIPKIALRDVGDEVLAVVVDGGDARVAGEHDRPLGLLVPMQFSDAAGFEPHVDAGHFGRDRQFPLSDFAGPASPELRRDPRNETLPRQTLWRKLRIDRGQIAAIFRIADFLLLDGSRQSNAGTANNVPAGEKRLALVVI